MILYEGEIGSLLPTLLHYFVSTFFHQPFRSAGGTTDADGFYALEPCHINFVGTLDEVAVGIDSAALFEEDFAIAALMTADKEDEVVARGKGCDVWHAVGNLTTDGVEALEGG